MQRMWLVCGRWVGLAMADDEMQQIERAVAAIHAQLAGRSPEIQGAILADLVATHLVGHPSVLREEMLQLFVATVRKLIPINHRSLFGDAGHPSDPLQ